MLYLSVFVTEHDLLVLSAASESFPGQQWPTGGSMLLSSVVDCGVGAGLRVGMDSSVNL